MNPSKDVRSLKDLFTDDSTDKRFWVLSIPPEKEDTFEYELKKEEKDSSKSSTSHKTPKKFTSEKVDKRGSSCACVIF